MELKGEYRIAAPREDVWVMLNDPDVLRDCIPGCESLEASGDGFAARVTTKIGPVKATFTGTVTLTNMNPPVGYTIVGEGKGGVAGFARGSADVHLAEDGIVTVLTYSADAKVGGKLAQLGSRLIDSTAKKLADEFFACFAARAVGEPARAEPVDVPAPAAPASEAGLPAATAIEPSAGARSTATAPAGAPPPAAPVTAVPAGTAAAGGSATPAAAAAAAVTSVPPAVALAGEEASAHAGRLDREASAGGPETPAAFPGETIPPAATGVPEVGVASEAAPAPILEEAKPATAVPHRHGAAEAVAHAAHDVEEEIELKAATGFLGGPVVWGLLVLAALIVFYFIFQ
ncbi:SRPBCC family protein [Faunimonas sp. B44]|uniref:SRPBCC family protein n=1 Tax=Faunimonas sp. B44 TaxID=3461493 RepID=UPI004044C140